jgi:hypothetical protein
VLDWPWSLDDYPALGFTSYPAELRDDSDLADADYSKTRDKEQCDDDYCAY